MLSLVRTRNRISGIMAWGFIETWVLVKEGWSNFGGCKKANKKRKLLHLTILIHIFNLMSMVKTYYRRRSVFCRSKEIQRSRMMTLLLRLCIVKKIVTTVYYIQYSTVADLPYGSIKVPLPLSFLLLPSSFSSFFRLLSLMYRPPSASARLMYSDSWIPSLEHRCVYTINCSTNLLLGCPFRMEGQTTNGPSILIGVCSHGNGVSWTESVLSSHGNGLIGQSLRGRFNEQDLVQTKY